MSCSRRTRSSEISLTPSTNTGEKKAPKNKKQAKKSTKKQKKAPKTKKNQKKTPKKVGKCAMPSFASSSTYLYQHCLCVCVGVCVCVCVCLCACVCVCVIIMKLLRIPCKWFSFGIFLWKFWIFQKWDSQAWGGSQGAQVKFQVIFG